MSRAHPLTVAVEHATARRPDAGDWQASLDTRRERLRRALGGECPVEAAPDWVLQRRREARQEAVRRELADGPTPALLDAARELDRRRSPFSRETSRRPR